MARVIGIGHQDFEKIIENNNFCVDRTDFIRQWWETGDDVTLITRPRRFGKTLYMSMLEQFFSVKYAGAATYLRDFPSGRRKNTAGGVSCDCAWLCGC